MFYDILHKGKSPYIFRKALDSYLKTYTFGWVLNRIWELIKKVKKKSVPQVNFLKNHKIPPKIPSKINHKNNSFPIVQISAHF